MSRSVIGRQPSTTTRSSSPHPLTSPNKAISGGTGIWAGSRSWLLGLATRSFFADGWDSDCREQDPRSQAAAGTNPQAAVESDPLFPRHPHHPRPEACRPVEGCPPPPHLPGTLPQDLGKPLRGFPQSSGLDGGGIKCSTLELKTGGFETRKWTPSTEDHPSVASLRLLSTFDWNACPLSPEYALLLHDASANHNPDSRRSAACQVRAARQPHLAGSAGVRESDPYRAEYPRADGTCSGRRMLLDSGNVPSSGRSLRLYSHCSREAESEVAWREDQASGNQDS